MSRTPQRHELMRKWAESVVPVEDHEASERRRDRVVASTERAIERAAAEAGAAKRRARMGALVAAAAVLLLAAGAAWRARHRPNEIAGANPAVETPAAPSSPSDEVVTTSEGAIHLDLSNGAAVTLEASSSFHLPDSLHEQARLDVGTVHVHVPRLHDGQTFAIKTPDAVVTVHGTSFTVEVGAFAGASRPVTTRVSVSEGTVSVSYEGREVFVGPGMRWVSPRPEGANEAPAPAPDNGARPRPPARETAHGASPTSTLPEQNRLLTTAIEAAHSGRYRAAVELLNELLQRFPSSPLAQEARVQRFRALKGTGDNAAAAREAQKYLATYPEGFAREEAKKIGTER